MKKLLISIAFILMGLSSQQAKTEFYEGCLLENPPLSGTGQWGSTDDKARNLRNCQNFCEAHFKSNTRSNCLCLQHTLGIVYLLIFSVKIELHTASINFPCQSE